MQTSPEKSENATIHLKNDKRKAMKEKDITIYLYN